MQAVDDVVRSPRRDQHAKDNIGFLTRRARFRERRHIRQRGRTPRARDGERADRALPDVSGGGGDGGIEDRRMPAEVEVIAGPPPLKETATRSSPKACLSISPARYPGVPSPAWA